jgi:hypothetical protein
MVANRSGPCSAPMHSGAASSSSPVRRSRRNTGSVLDSRTRHVEPCACEPFNSEGQVPRHAQHLAFASVQGMLGKSLRLDGVELGLRDRAGIEQGLRRADLLGGVGAGH